MQTYFVTFRSVTYAQRSERILKDAGIRCTLQRSPKAMEERGCGYSLTLRQQDLHRGLSMLRQAQVPLRKVYVRGNDGRTEEVAL